MLVSARALTVFVVAHNDSQKLLATIDRIYNALTVTVEDFSILIFDDGSTDDTLAVAKAASEKYPFVSVRRNERRMGPGYCAIAGSRDASTPFVIYAPADNTWPQRSFVELFGNLGKADVVTSYSNNLLAAMPFFKRLVSRSYTMVLNLLFGRMIRYYNGLTIYPTEFLAQGPLETHGFGFQAEALLKAVASGYSFLEITLPVDAKNLPLSRSRQSPSSQGERTPHRWPGRRRNRCQRTGSDNHRRAGPCRLAGAAADFGFRGKFWDWRGNCAFARRTRTSDLHLCTPRRSPGGRGAKLSWH